jgi:hypothetical protein
MADTKLPIRSPRRSRFARARAGVHPPFDAAGSRRSGEAAIMGSEQDEKEGEMVNTRESDGGDS